ncbi:Peptide deformylase [Candidatus Hodgkinia cicadicola]|uniref:Peptide deformylase n=1 Tax=Candidatus Hodgkinia cicadicola TaxID=573658 RepID=A0ABX4MH87_9HYPH|nr:Peptide deformylase [Candidatus Hodgkinia cicadicola]
MRYPSPCLRFNRCGLPTLNILYIHRLMHLTLTNFGLGLSSTQLGWLYNSFAVYLPMLSFKKNLHVLAYHSVALVSEYKDIYYEGCLSLAIKYPVNRARKFIIICYDVLRDVVCAIKSKSLFSACLQHEHDHILGSLISDNQITNNYGTS